MIFGGPGVHVWVGRSGIEDGVVTVWERAVAMMVLAMKARAVFGGAKAAAATDAVASTLSLRQSVVGMGNERC